MSNESSEGTDADPWAVPKFTQGTNVSRVIPRAKSPSIESDESTNAALRAWRNDLTEYFFKWRRHGNDSPGGWDGATMDRRVKSRINKIPIKSSWKGPGNFSGLVRRGKKKIGDWGDGGGPPEKEAWAMARSRWLVKQLVRIKLRHVKTLGWGGLGVVNLFEQERPDGEIVKVVCKVDIDGDKGYLAREIEAHMGTAGAKHISQRIPPGYLARPNGQPIEPAPATVPSSTIRSFGSDLMMMSSGDEAKVGKGKRPDALRDAIPLWDSREVLFLEFMSRGDLRKVVVRMAEGLTTYGSPPPLTLWHIFGSLFKGVVGMAYPRVFMPEEFKTPYMSDYIVPQASESCLGLPKLTPYCEYATLVHFDLDLSNVLVGDYDTYEHNATPIAKIADLGLCHPFDGDRASGEFRWSCRRRGKRSIFAPEQFTEEWDHVKDSPRESGAKTAGNYNWWTNLYQVGIIMYSLITLCEYDTPPTPNFAAVRYPDGSEKEVWGYGMDLLVCGYSHLDFDLVNVIAACLCHDPADRPDLHDLERLIRAKVTAQPLDGPAAKIARDWGRRYFEGAPPPRYQPAPSGRERLRLWQNPGPGAGPGGPTRPSAVRQPGVQAGLAQQRAASLATFRGQQQHGAPSGREQQRAASAAIVPGQQPGLQAGRGQQPAAQAGRGQQPRFPAGKGHTRVASGAMGPGLQPGFQIGRGQQSGFQIGRGQQRAASGAFRPGQQPWLPAGRGQQPLAQAGWGQPPPVSATADRWRQAGFPTDGQPSATDRTSRTHFQAPSGLPNRKGG